MARTVGFAPEEGGNLPPEAIEADIPVVDLTLAAEAEVKAQGAERGTGDDPAMPADADTMSADVQDAAENQGDEDTAAAATDTATEGGNAWVHGEKLPAGEFPNITPDIIYETAAKILPKFEKIAKETDYQTFGIFYSEGLLLCAAAVAAQVDVILESGTAGGMSAELMARFFADTNVKIFTVDADANQYEKKGGLLSSTAARLAPWKNLKCLRANSFKQWPALIEEHKGKRIGTFVDGPKREDGMKLCLRAMRASKDVMFCGLHDIAPLWKHSVDKLSNKWGRKLVHSIDAKWRAKYGYLDKTYVNWKKIPKDYFAGTKKHGFGLGLFYGMHYVPDGAKEDNNKKLQRRLLGLPSPDVDGMIQ